MLYGWKNIALNILIQHDHLADLTVSYFCICLNDWFTNEIHYRTSVHFLTDACLLTYISVSNVTLKCYFTSLWLYSLFCLYIRSLYTYTCAVG